MESENDLLIHITQDEIKSNNIQVIAYAFTCVHYDMNNKIAVVTHSPGTVKIYKLPNGKKCIAMYGVIVQRNLEDCAGDEYKIYKSQKEASKWFEVCLTKISKIRNLKSIAFSKDTFGNDKYITALQKFSENIEALVYTYSTIPNTKSIVVASCKNNKEVNTVHKSFGDLLGNIVKWKTEKAGWDVFFRARIEDKTIATLNAFLQKEAEEYFIYPPPEQIFNAMILCKLSNVKVIVIGQNPYYVSGAAMGLAFSHNDDYGKLQPSLQNIYKELESCGYKVNKKSGNLLRWAQNGVFLINTGLTVRQGQADSHMKEWKPFTEHLFTFLNKEIKHAVVIMWGGPAQTYSKYFDDKKHKKIMSSHPCPMSANISFFGSKPFVKCNQYLKEWGMKEIDWNLV